MADAVDIANDRMEQELAAIISAARGVLPPPATHCADCDEPLPKHRQQYGRCLPCQTRRESAIRRGLISV